MPGYHTPKERRQAAHIERALRRKGVPVKRARSTAWRTVNASRHTRKRRRYL
jgi:hypothetical protein